MNYELQLILRNKFHVLILFLIAFVSNIYCDLPIQCVKHQIVGKWKIQTNRGFKNPDGFIKCGHSFPDNPKTSYQSFVNKFKVHQEQIVELLENGQVILTSDGNETQKGSWSMMYDEGLSIEVNEKSYLTFFKYYPIKEEEVSEDIKINMITIINHIKVTSYEYDCTETIIGWYTDHLKGIKGCMKAYKLEGKDEDRHLRSESKGNVVQPLDMDINNFEFQEEILNDDDASDIIVDQSSGSSLIKKRKTPLQNALNDIVLDLEVDYPTGSDNQGINKTQENSTQRIFENQTQHKDRIQQLNTLDKNWQAGISSSFKDLSLDQLNKKSGRTQRKSQARNKSQGVSVSSPSNLKEEEEQAKRKRANDDDLYMHFSINDVSDLPKQFSWEEYIDPPFAQSECGSCYIISTVSMLNARIKIKYGKDFTEKISMQHLLDCSFYSQGCEGGYPFEIGRFGKDYFLVPERLAEFQNEVKKCKYNRLSQLDDYFKITDYGFVGKQYGRGNEREMMLEIMQNGPIVANFKTSTDFVYYQSGVYHSVSAADWILKCQKEPEWRPVEHAVMCYGWGESEEDGKFWLMQNSWGEDWGEKGRFKIRRGTDESFIESSAEYAQVEYIKQKQVD